jgi:hypothetical protein
LRPASQDTHAALRYSCPSAFARVTHDRVAAENYYQHAEHYFRIANAGRDQQGPASPADAAVREEEQGVREADRDGPQSGWGDDRPGFV